MYPAFPVYPLPVTHARIILINVCTYPVSLVIDRLSPASCFALLPRALCVIFLYVNAIHYLLHHTYNRDPALRILSSLSSTSSARAKHRAGRVLGVRHVIVRSP